MRKFLIVLLCMALGICLASSAMAYSGSYVPGAGINGTVHDLGTPGANGMNYGANPPDPLTRICIFCHAPHNTMRLFGVTAGAGPVDTSGAFTYLPLWNHTLQDPFNPAYVMYTNGPGAPQSGPLEAQVVWNPAVAPTTPGSTSLLCLSCHDGTVAVNSWGNPDQLATSQSTGSHTIAQNYMIGKDRYLGNHHPISFDYIAVQALDPNIRPSSTFLTGAPAAISTIQDHLYGNNMECGTCHSVHNKGNTGEHLLWRSDQNSQLCLTCHTQGTYTTPGP